MPDPGIITRYVYDLRHASEPRVSPDGRRIVYTLRQADRATRADTSQVWISDHDGTHARRLTWGRSRDSGARWSPDGSAIAFVSDRGASAGSGIYLLPADGPGEARELTRHAMGIGGLAWSPDGTRIAYNATFDPENPDERQPDPDAPPPVRATRRIDYKRDGAGWLGDARPHIFVVDVASGARRRLTRDAVEHGEPVWSPDGTAIATTSADWTRGTSRVLLIDAASGESRLAGPAEGMAGGLAWSPSGDRLLFDGAERWTAQPDYFVLDHASGAVRRLTDDLAVLPVAPPVWLDGQQALIHALRHGTSELLVIDTESGALERVQAWNALHAGLSVDRSGQVVVQEQGGFDAIGELVVHDLHAGTSAVVTRFNAGVLDELPGAGWERLSARRGDVELEGWLLTPPNFDPAKTYPTVLCVHGGPEGVYGHSFNSLQQCLAQHGFLVVIANPRGSVSYGRAFTDAVHGDWGIEPLADLLAVLDVVLARPYADPARVGITGGSYGGYMTAWAIGVTRRFAAAVAVAVTFDLESQYLGADFDHAYGDVAWGGPPWANRAWYDAQSPSSYVHQVTAPTLILHGEEDHRCPIGQAEEMFGALKKAGCEAELVRYPGGSHGFARNGPPDHRLDYLTRVVNWFERYV